MARSPQALRCSYEQNALHTLIRPRHPTPSCGERSLYRGENRGLGKDNDQSLTPDPELENKLGPVQKWAVALITIAGIAPVEDRGRRGAAAPPSAPVDQSAGGDTRIRLVADNRHASASDRF